jgi:hypothetical protein
MTRQAWKTPLVLCCVMAWVCFAACHIHPADRETTLRAEFHRRTGSITLPPGVTELHKPLQFDAGAHDINLRGDASGSTLLLAKDFEGRAAILGVNVANVRLEKFQVIGDRAGLVSNLYLPASNVRFADYYDRNGVVFVTSQSITIRDVSLRNIRTFPILITSCRGVVLEDIEVRDSGTLNAQGHSNTTGGILLEEGTMNFSVKRCHIENICGNGIWTHSNYESPRNQDGVIANNEIRETPRDLIQVGHATRIQVLDNRGGRVGFPVAEADLPGGATPVALDSSGDTSEATYSGNQFEDVNGQCIDLDGFHDGRVVNNSCVNRKPAAAYPLSHVGIVFGNSNPDMRPQGVVVSGNLIQGFGYGGVYLIGEHQEVSGNRFIDVNRNRCSGDVRVAVCNYAPEEPDMLRSGIYLATHSPRHVETRGNRIWGNYISGFGMDRWCITAGPGARLDLNTIGNNTCVTHP